jgi:hypothetical protein
LNIYLPFTFQNRQPFNTISSRLRRYADQRNPSVTGRSSVGTIADFAGIPVLVLRAATQRLGL